MSSPFQTILNSIVAGEAFDRAIVESGIDLSEDYVNAKTHIDSFILWYRAVGSNIMPPDC